MAKNSSKDFQSAEIVKTAEGRQYHIGLAPNELAPFILLCGDPARVKRTAALFDKIEIEAGYREYLTITGKYHGIPVSVMGTGMGPDNTEIAIVEISQIVDSPTFIRIGTSGTLKKEISNGELIISNGAVRLENTSTYFVCEGYPALAHHEVIMALLESAGKQGFTHHLGMTATAPSFYGAQCRTTPHFKPRNPELIDQLIKMNVANFEMEASSLFSLASVAGYRAGAVCAVIAERHTNRFIDTDGLKKVEMDCIKTGLGAIEVLAKMDKIRGKKAHWVPSLGLGV
jgi:uridine phosphorylase